MSVQTLRPTQEPSRLGIAFLTALLLHGAALTAVTFWPSDKTEAPGEQEITIDFAPALEEIVSAEPAVVQAQEVPPIEAEPIETETTEEQPPEEIVEAQPQEITEVAPIEALPVEPETTDTEAVVALPPPETVIAKPVVEKPAPKKEPPRKPVERKPPPRRTIAEQRPPSEARQGQASASRENMGGAAASADPNVLNSYKASLRSALQRRLRLNGTRIQGATGSARVRFTLDRSGRIVSSSLVSSSGNPAIDQAVLATVNPGSSLPAVPASISEFSYNIPLGFTSR